jgi:hypothetical protein
MGSSRRMDQVARPGFVDPVVWVIEPVRIGHGIEVVQVPEKFIEPMHRRKIFVTMRPDSSISGRRLSAARETVDVRDVHRLDRIVEADHLRTRLTRTHRARHPSLALCAFEGLVLGFVFLRDHAWHNSRETHRHLALRTGREIGRNVRCIGHGPTFREPAETWALSVSYYTPLRRPDLLKGRA